MSITLNDTQWNLAFLASTVGKSVVTGNDIYAEETITLGASGAGTVTGTPKAIQGATLYGWVSHVDGTVQRVTFSGSTFASSTGTSGDVVCVRYYKADAASTSVLIPASAIPKVLRLVMEAPLNSSDVATNLIGKVQFVVYKAILSGSFTLNLKSDGVSQTPLSAMALAYSDSETASCTSEPVYAKIIEVIDNANWYDSVVALAISGGNFGITAGTSPKTLVVYGIKDDGISAPFVIDNSLLDFTSATTATATAGLHTGIITRIANGTSVITVSVTAVPTIEAQCTVTAS
jgi:hypothetical protein